MVVQRVVEKANARFFEAAQRNDGMHGVAYSAASYDFCVELPKSL